MKIWLGAGGLSGPWRTLLCLGLALLMGATTHCDSDDTVNATWNGSYRMSDSFGGGSGNLSFVVTGSDDIFCFMFSGSASAYSTSCNNGSQGFPVNNLQFSIPLTTSQGTFTLQGKFLSSTQASGEVTGPGGSSETVLTWAASETSTGEQ